VKKKYLFLFLVIIGFSTKGFSQDNRTPLSDKGFIPVWNVVGPFEQPLFGFGVPVDKDVIGEKEINSFAGTYTSDLVKEGKVNWFPQSISPGGFLDFNKTLMWALPGKSPEKIWYAITGYAAAEVYSDVDQKAVIKFGSNSFGKILVNHQEVFSIQNVRNARIDENTIETDLKKGRNVILVKTGNSDKNHALAFFEKIEWQWGFYFRLLDEEGGTLKNVQVALPEEKPVINFKILSTFFFKKINNNLHQRFDIELTSPYSQQESGKIAFETGNNIYSFDLDPVYYGLNRYSIFIPEITSPRKVETILSLNDQTYKKEVELFPAKHYELHVMMLAHTDIGYTHPQPVVEEIHAATLDDVISMCEEHPDFKWTIETVWQLEQYENSRTLQQFSKLVDLIKSGRIAVSPLYANPFTGWIGEEEMIRSLKKAQEYKEKYGFEYHGVVYNDVPGQSWILPQVLDKSGVYFLAEGINELFNDYSLQRSLPKAFTWEGPDGSKVTTYLNEAYNEGRAYALEGRGNFAVQQRMWQRLNRLADRSDHEMVLLNSAFTDNSGIPKEQFAGMHKWNEEYEYPKFISSTLSDFALLFNERYGDNLPELKGDWTSPWDSDTQGEPGRMKTHRWIQHNILSAEKISTLTALMDKKVTSFSEEINDAYNSLLHFSGHGSGLEYGYGSPADNIITMEFRQSYINDALMKTEEVLQKGIYRFSRPHESFEGEGIIIFNTLSWERDAPVEIQFPAESDQQYEVVDLVTNKIVPSFRDEYKLYFIAEDLPSMGFKKYRLNPKVSITAKSKELFSSPGMIENQFYKIRYDSESKSISSILDKKSGKELVDDKHVYGFNVPLIKTGQENYSMIKPQNEILTIKDENPVRIILRLERSGELVEKTEYILWSNIDRVDIVHVFNLQVLEETQKIQQFSVGFPFNISDKKIKLELLGGFLDPEKEKLPGSSNNSHSIRRSVALYNDRQSISWSAVDSRIVQINDNVLLSNAINNFPKDWNRYESNEGKLRLNYSFTSQEGKFNSSYTARFGWELNTPPVLRRSWYSAKPVSGSYFTIDNEFITILSISSATSDEYQINFTSMSDREEEGFITSEFFEDCSAVSVNYLGEAKEKVEVNENSIKIKFKPNEIKTIKFSKFKK
jgi:hypothetical protein